jgi:hypothetical protein
VRHQDGRAGLRRPHVLQPHLQIASGERVERAERFVEKHRRARREHGSQQREALTHATTQLRRPRSFEPGQTEAFELGAGGGDRFGVWYAVHFGTEDGVTDRAPPWEEQITLRLEGDRSRSAGHVDSVDEHLTRSGKYHAGHDAQQRRFPAPARTDDAHELSGIDRQRYAVEHDDIVGAPVEAMANVAELDRVLAHAQPDGFGR